jgi:hypothetical protein
MKRFLIFTAVATVAITGALVWHVSSARGAEEPMTEAHIARIRSNCVEAQSTLTQLHTSDALLRVNRGQLYESISTKLMAPFNSRVAINKLDGTTLVALATDYERELAAFRLNYQQYEEAMSKTLKINCANQPVAFYDSIGDTRAKRRVTHDSTLALQKTIQDYKNEFEAFARKFQESHS